jgi:hypothetical protein
VAIACANSNFFGWRREARSGRLAVRIAHHVNSLRKVHGIHAYRWAEKNGEWLTMFEAAVKLGVTNHGICRLIKDRILAAE